MSVNEDTHSLAGIDGTDHQAAYIFAPPKSQNDHILDDQRPNKRRKVGRPSIETTKNDNNVETYQLAPLLDDQESPELRRLRLKLFKNHWADTEEKIECILNEANEGTLSEVTSFVQNEERADKMPAGFIVTGPNISSQGLLFEQLSARLSSEINGPVITLRSGEASNLKMLLKKLIRDATNQRTSNEVEDGNYLEQDGRKLLNYDLESVYGYVRARGCNKVVVSFQDSEAFDSGLLADVISLFGSWRDRIPFILLFGIATSVDLFQERLSRSASRNLYGAQFDVEQTSSILEKIFRKVVAGHEASLRLGPGLLSSLMARQNDYVQSVQTFIEALKYAYMCHFYGNSLSILLGLSDDPHITELLQPEHFGAIRTLTSFQCHIEGLVKQGKLHRSSELITDDEVLGKELQEMAIIKDKTIKRVLRAMHVLINSQAELPGPIDLYMKASTGALMDSEIMHAVVESIKRGTLDHFLVVAKSIKEAVESGDAELDLQPWADAEPDFYQEVLNIFEDASSLAESEAGKSIRSSYNIHNRALRTTIISQKVQLSQEKSSLTNQDKKYTALVDRLIHVLQEFVTVEKLQDQFLSEIWIYDMQHPYQDAFTPKPRFAIERALSFPHDYLSCSCCDPTNEGASMSHPPTAILYKLYQEAGTVINIFDLWTAFVANLGLEDDDDGDESERRALMLFYKSLADLKLLGMIKQSRKKTDHLTKMAWKGL